MVYIVIACHFKNGSQLCETTIARLKTAISVIKKDDRIIVTGDVPYKLGGKTLGELMKNWLESRKFPEKSISLLKGAVGTFSEARISCELLKHEGEIVVISSRWYLFSGGLIWQKYGRDNGVSVSFVSVPNTGGWRTILTYIIFGLIVRLSATLGLERVLEEYITASQDRRREGFTFNGCR